MKPITLASCGAMFHLLRCHPASSHNLPWSGFSCLLCVEGEELGGSRHKQDWLVASYFASSHFLPFLLLFFSSLTSSPLLFLLFIHSISYHYYFPSLFISSLSSSPCLSFQYFPSLLLPSPSSSHCFPSLSSSCLFPSITSHLFP